MAARLKAVALDRLIAWGRGALMQRVVRLARGLACTVGLVVASGVSWAQSPGFAVSGASTTPSVPQAVGLIVKLREAGATRASVGSQAAATGATGATGATSVVRIAASRTPSDSAASQQQRLTQALQRRGVRHLGHRATAFAARALRFEAPMSREQAQLEAQRLRADPDVEWVVVDEVLRPQAAYVGQPVSANANPDYASQQAWLQPRAGRTDRYGVADFPTAWAKLNGRALTPVTVAVLDSGVPQDSEWANADLEGRMWPGYDFVSSALFSRDGGGLDPDPTDPGDWLTAADLAAIPEAQRTNCTVHDSGWHGLGVSYVLAAATENRLHGAGALAPLPGKVVLPVRVGGACGAAMSDIIEGMLWAAGVSYQGQPTEGLNPNPARIINLSFGADGDCADTGVGTQNWLYRQTLDSLAQKGALVVASAGNGDDATGLGKATPSRPASCAGVLAVTGLNAKGYKAGYANLLPVGVRGLAVASGDIDAISKRLFDNDPGFGTLINISQRAPATGTNAYSVSNLRVGTSYAAPQAAAVAALMLAVEPRLTVSELLTMITDQVQPFLPVSGFATCTATNTGHCSCTQDTCGSGVLDAGLAVAKAIEHTSLTVGGSIPGSDPVVSSFTPDRGAGVNVAQPSGSGGGGSVDDLACLALAVLALAVTWARRRPLHATYHASPA